MKTFSITIDVEQDFGGRVDSFRGINESLPKVLEIFKKHNVYATFFVSGPILKKFPKIIKHLEKFGHEIAAHGTKHIKLKELSEEDADIFLAMTRKEFLLHDLSPVGFRAPYLAPHKKMPLQKYGFIYDSSLTNAFFPGRYFGLHLPNKPFKKEDYLECPVTRLPWHVFTFTILQASMPYCISLKSSADHTTMFFHLHDLLVWGDTSMLHGAIKSAYRNKTPRFDLLEKIILANQDKRFVTLRQKTEAFYNSTRVN